MSAYLIVWHETDGNDATVYDTVVSAKSKDAAVDKLLDSQMASWPDAESDGDSGLLFACDCPEDTENCDGHGGTIIREIRSFRSLAQAREAMAFYHREWTV